MSGHTLKAVDHAEADVQEGDGAATRIKECCYPVLLALLTLRSSTYGLAYINHYFGRA